MLQTLKKPVVRKLLLAGVGLGVVVAVQGRRGRSALEPGSGETNPAPLRPARKVLARLHASLTGLAGLVTDRAPHPGPGFADRAADGRSRIPTPAELAARVAANEGRAVVTPG
jgi:hypothetical protein